MLRPMRLAAPAVFILTLSSCGGEFGSEVETKSLATNNVPPVTQIVGASELARYKAALPDVAWKRLQDIFDSPTTLWYDKVEMIPSYQDSVGDGSFTPIGARANAGGRRIIVQEGKRLFNPNDLHWSFPFGVTAGTDRVADKVVLNFLSLPDDGNNLFPVVYVTIDNDRALGGLGLHKWQWMYPKGTVVGEVLFLENGGQLYTSEIRTRTRYSDGWATNVFRPFPTANHLANAIRTARPNWASQSNLQALVNHLEDNSTLQSRRIDSPGFNNLVTLDGHLDTIPSFGDATLVAELLTTTTFVSTYGLAWKENGNQITYAASTQEAFSIVPANYDAGLLEVRESSCVRCHDNAGRAIDDFEPAAILYGDIWGEDRIFSFHPWNQDRYVTFNNENREVRPEFAADGLVVRYDPGTHTSDRYAWIDQPRQP